MSDSDQDKKKKLSGYQNLMRKRKREEDRDKNATKISKYFPPLPSTSKESFECIKTDFIDESNKTDSKNPSCSGMYFLNNLLLNYITNKLNCLFVVFLGFRTQRVKMG